MKRNWAVVNKIHIIVWLIFVIYETFIVGLLFKVYANPVTYLAHYLVIISYFYFNAHVSLPWALSGGSRKIIRIPLIVLLQLVCYILFHYVIDKMLIGLRVIPFTENYKLDTDFALKNLYRGGYFLGFSTGYYFLLSSLKERKRREQLDLERLENIIEQKNTEQELSKAQNAFLKAQINPHFLFNTLNFVYNEINVLSPRASDAIISLSDMMRFAIDADRHDGLTDLDEEIVQAQNLIHLFRLRKGKDLYIHVSVNEEVRHIRLIPLILLTLLENMFKHGDLTGQNHPGLLTVFVKDDFFFIETVNRVRPNPFGASYQHTGLSNIHKRLNYAYGSDIVFERSAPGSEEFKVKVGVRLSALSFSETKTVSIQNGR